MPRRDAALLLVAAAIIFALLLVGRASHPNPTSDNGWRDIEQGEDGVAPTDPWLLSLMQ